MKIIPETKEDIVAIIAHEFRSFGGGKVSEWNPISIALKDSPPQFAAGVGIKEVSERVIELYEQVKRGEMKTPHQ